MKRQRHFKVDDVYKNTPLEDIPWNIETPPQLLVELLDSGKVRPCKAIDLGCGAGNHAVYLAGKGFDVTGIDFSPTAIRLAKRNAEKKSVKCNFFVADAVSDLDKVNQTWDFAYDWGLLHHIFPQQRKKYIKNVHRILNRSAKYLSLCFSEKDTAFQGSGKYRKTTLGSVLYLSSEHELRNLFQPYFHIIDLRTIEISGKFVPHVFNYAFMEKK